MVTLNFKKIYVAKANCLEISLKIYIYICISFYIELIDNL